MISPQELAANEIKMLLNQSSFNDTVEFERGLFNVMGTSLIALEKQLTINNRKKRTDILVFDKEGNHDIIVECKAPHIKITQAAFDQIARYNLKLKAKYLIVTNGLDHFYCKMDFKNETYIFLKGIPDYK
jgi:hypothetical protein